MKTISKIRRVSLREVWKHEARDFTQWLQGNLDVLSEITDTSLASAEKEQSAGTFSVDLVAEDVSGNTVVIENQLEKSDHDHLGKLITYLVSVGAKTAIWIVSDPRPEHTGAISWLNESSSADFYLVKVEAITIDDSPPAPLMTLIAGPTIEGRDIGKTKKNLSERQHQRLDFWTQLLARSKEKSKLHENISPGAYHWVGASAGINGLAFNFSIWQREAGVELYIDRGKEKGEQNFAIFEQLFENKKEVENVLGGEIEWERLDGKRACRIRKKTLGGGFQDKDKWEDIIENVTNDMVRLEKALRPHIDKVKID
ncbi:MAG: DUF4268 domain-containing protein [Verrucomicrobiales bacterium]